MKTNSSSVTWPLRIPWCRRTTDLGNKHNYWAHFPPQSERTLNDSFYVQYKLHRYMCFHQPKVERKWQRNSKMIPFVISLLNQTPKLFLWKLKPILCNQNPLSYLQLISFWRRKPTSRCGIATNKMYGFKVYTICEVSDTQTFVGL